ncbi:winged helix DNA-binding protein [Candidatus Woesearchaeota archaeon]|nr:winged helix DNA-binding protein [Candidatus Woesearchaeota archaeon]
MNQKRNRLTVIHDILRVIQKKNSKIKPTHIIYKANLSHAMLEEYMKEMIEKGFVEEQKQKKGKTYSLTEKGFNFLKEYKTITAFLESYGLGD